MGGVDSLEFEEIIALKSLSGETKKHPFRFDRGQNKLMGKHENKCKWMTS